MAVVGVLPRNALHTTMKTVIRLYENIKQSVWFLYHKLKLAAREKNKGRKLAIPRTCGRFEVACVSLPECVS